MLEKTLAARREAGLLGNDICGKAGVNFDIRIHMGAGAYICGEETALLSSCEGLRGDPKNRPPFPAQKGYLGQPSIVNNVETFCCAARIVEHGSAWFAALGSDDSPGTKLLSVSGDCLRPGVYELPFGVRLREVLEMVGAERAGAVLVGGASGKMVGPDAYDRRICYEDLATGGSIVVFDRGRDVLAIARDYMKFFVHESCGYCTPCRVGSRLMLQRLERILAGRGEPDDLPYLESLGRTMIATSRCGLGQTAPNPILSTMEAFPEAYRSRLREPRDGRQSRFDIQEALRASESITGRPSVHFTEKNEVSS